MAKLGLGVAGAAIGFVITGGNPMGAQLGFTAGIIIGGLLFPEKLPAIIGPRLDNLDITSAAYGSPIRVIYGTFRVGTVLMWSTGLKETQNTEKISVKGGQSQKNVTFTYSSSWASIVCEGPMSDVLQIFFNKRLVYDVTGSGPIESGVLELGKKMEIYLGTETQDPSPLIQADKGIDDTPAFRGTCYLAFDDVQLADTGNALPQSLEVVISSNTTNDFPFNSIPHTRALQMGTLDDDRDTLYSIQDGGVAVVDFTSESILITATDSELQVDSGLFSPRGAPFDRDKNIYVIVSETLDRAVERYDYPDYQLSGTSGFTGPDSFGNTFGLLDGNEAQGINVISPVLVGLAGQSAASDKVVVAHGNEVSVIDTTINPLVTYLGTPQLPILVQYDFQVIFNRATNYSNFGLVLKDEITQNAFAMLMWSDAKTIDMVQIEPSSGGLVGSSHQFALTTATDGSGGFLAAFDSTRNAIIYTRKPAAAGSELPEMLMYDIETKTVIQGPVYGSFSMESQNQEGNFRVGPAGNDIMWILESGVSERFIHEFDVEAFEFTGTTVDFRDWVGTIDVDDGPVTGFYYDFKRDTFVVGTDVTLYFLYNNRKSPNPIALSTIISDVSLRTPLVSADIDVTELTDLVEGAVIDGRTQARSFIEALKPYYQFGIVESDWIVKYPKLAKSSVRTIPVEDLGVSNSLGADTTKIEETIDDAILLPNKVEVGYAAADFDYQPLTQYAKRSDEATPSEEMRIIPFPIATSDHDEAKGVAETLLYTAHNQAQGAYSIKSHWEHIDLDPLDVINVDTDTFTVEVILTEVNFGNDWSVEMSAFREGNFTYTPSDEPAQVPLGFIAQSLKTIGKTDFHIIDNPLLRDQDDGLIIYVSAGSFGDPNTIMWNGSVTHDSLNAIDFKSIAFFDSSQNATQGYVENLIADFSDNVWDDTNTITVKIWHGTPSSSTDLGVLNGANIGLFGDEYIQWVNVTSLGSNRYTLSRLLRARKGTTFATSTHAAGERFIVLSESKQRLAVYSDSDLNTLFYYRSPTINKLLGTGDLKEHTFVGRSEMPLQATHIGASQDQDLDWNMTWIPSTRIGAEWIDNVEPPLGETVESYEVDIEDSSSNVLRTLAVSTPAATYTQEQQEIDGGGSPDFDPLLEGNIYQLNGAGRRGFAAPFSFVSTNPQAQSAIQIRQFAEGGRIFTADPATTTLTLDLTPNAGSLMVIMVSIVSDNGTFANRNLTAPTGYNLVANPHSTHQQGYCRIYAAYADDLPAPVSVDLVFDSFVEEQFLVARLIEITGAASTGSPYDVNDFSHGFNSSSTQSVGVLSLDQNNELYLAVAHGSVSGFWGVDTQTFTWDNDFVKMGTDRSSDPGGAGDAAGSGSFAFKYVVSGAASAIGWTASPTNPTEDRTILWAVK